MTKKHQVFLVLIIFLGIIFRLPTLAARDLTYDEAYNTLIAQKPLATVVKVMASQTAPPLFHFLHHFWMTLGKSVLFMRLLPLVFGVSSLFLIYPLSRSLFGKNLALVNTLLFAISPVFVFSSQNLRMYSLAILESYLIIYFFLKYLKSPGKLNSWGLIIFFTLSLYTHYFFVFLFLVFNLFFLATWPKYQNRLKSFFVIQAAAALLYSPWVFLFFLSPKESIIYPAVKNALFKLPIAPVTLVFSFDALLAMGIHSFNLFLPKMFLPFLIFSLFFGSFLLGLKRALKTHPDETKFFLLYLLAPVGACFLVSIFIKPIFSLHSFVLFSPAFYFPISFGFSSFSKKTLRPFLAAFSLLILFFLKRQADVLGSYSGSIREAAHELRQELKTTDVIAHQDTSSFILFQFYLDQDFRSVPLTTFLLSPAPTEHDKIMGFLPQPISEVEKLGQRIWYVSTYAQYPLEPANQTKSYLDQKFALAGHNAYNQLEIFLYEPR